MTLHAGMVKWTDAEWQEQNKDRFAEPGTFEWALIQMKAGKDVRRAATEYLYHTETRDGVPSDMWRVNLIVDGVPDFISRPAQNHFLDEDLFATDWQIYEEG